MREVVRGPLLTVLHRQNQGRRPKLTREERVALVPRFTEDIRLLEELTGSSFADWLTDSHLTREPL
jgi:hypothetical protein